jgi:ABC-2 type transport system permease protein
MTGVRQGWLVARREVRERIRSKALWAGTAIMLLVVLAAIVVPALVESGTVTRHVGFTGAVPDALPRATVDQGDAVDVTVRVHRYDDESSGEEAVRDEDIDVLVVDARRLEWRDRTDERLRAVLVGAIQLVAVQERAAAAGISPDELAALAAPVPIESDELGIAAGRSPDDETAAYVMSILLLIAIAAYGQLVMTGVVQEKSSRVVEVLLARLPARSLLAGKIAGIGLLGFTQFAVTALAALVATLAVDTVDIPTISGDVLAWVVAWFVLGYVMYATAYGAFGSLASRTEDASSIAAPVTAVLVVGYWASLMAVGHDPDARLAQLVSLFPATAPYAMPGRIALGAAAWWEPILAAALTLVAIAGLVAFAGRVYSGAILHTGATLKLRDAWRRTSAAAPAAVEPGTPPVPPQTSRATPEGRAKTTRTKSTVDRWTLGVLLLAVGLGAAVAVLANDVIVGVAVGAAVYAVATRVLKARANHDDRHPSRARTGHS